MHQCKVYFNIGLPYDKEKFFALLKKKKTPKEIKSEDISVMYADEVEKELNSFGVKYIRHSHAFEVNTNEHYEVYISDMVRDVIVPFVGQERWLIHLQKKYHLEYTLEILPTIDLGTEEVKPCLSLDQDIIAFLYLTKTQFDMDYSVLEKDSKN